MKITFDSIGLSMDAERIVAPAAYFFMDMEVVQCVSVRGFLRFLYAWHSFPL
mgnify:CR=1 FL=1